ncbi:MAG TPA: FAD-containing oxidoreductase [Burkholderiales bacterium]|jgi:pyruvate/2-oxoglutarate dehydrogenase complex dihydrolipoamide dehydrogenase (E3) component
MPDVVYDAIVIGTGQAGPALAARLSGAGMRVAVIERGKFGGTCVNNGCIPTKTLVASAYAAHLARRAAEYGVELAAPVRVDMRRVKARKDAVSGQSSRGVESWMRGLDNAAVYQGHARFVAPKRVRVSDHVLTAERIFINVGGRPLVPDMPGMDRVRFLTNVDMMEVDFLPEHLVVIGGSYIGLEFGQIFRRFGSRVTVVEMGPHLIGREDEDVSAAIKDVLESEGIEIRLDAKCLAVEPTATGVATSLGCASGVPRLAGSHLLLAVGRVPNTDDLGLDAAGIETDARGYIRVDDALRTSVEGVWALGDCNGRGAFTHTSYNDYEIVADNLLSDAGRKVTDRVPVYALFTDPPLGRVGLSESEARRAGHRVLVGKRPMTRVARAVEKGETQGFMKLVADADTNKLLGAAILGTGGDEVVHSVLDAIYAGLPYTAVQRAMRIHPTVSELIPTVLGELQPA